MTWINIGMNIIVIFFLLTGTFFIFSTSIGLLRFPDIYTRLHASTKAATLGVAGILIGSFLFLYAEHGIVSGKLLLGIAFMLLTAPVSGHMISRAAHNSGVKPWGDKVEDEYEKVKNLKSE
ncbi:monovalent cation/H(+) antiporter subunit G [Aquibacillus sp. 3ASR75-11]|uniref:Monovalent cation/H(+) antiporter subunit G n=1 Tax=Terrihalobacillus insolitus TaxID=2950438 RepID=A0A9X3WSX8_9BACI|nr:monovalent cation/H(+) antiporter subunit G [Terrihalobacillus insolitus]MDC3413307.1 monovalent cation/H(+) antiporter subunit G [Terrihalobacillus insolitus]MDC3424890.1 monovalent cation/H(+) antiporter subunit G [Terrihalobacillus insolitus]